MTGKYGMGQGATGPRAHNGVQDYRQCRPKKQPSHQEGSTAHTHRADAQVQALQGYSHNSTGAWLTRDDSHVSPMPKEVLTQVRG